MSDSCHRTIILTQNRYLRRRSRQKICPLAGNGLASLGHSLMESFFSPSASVFSYSLSSDSSARKVCITVCILEGKLTGSLVVESPKLVLIIGCVGLALNILSASFLHGSLPSLSLYTQRLIYESFLTQNTTIAMITSPEET